MTDILDEADFIKDQYFLEVSSPGVERVLRKDWQLKEYIGTLVEIKLFKKDELGNKSYEAILDDVDNLKIIVKLSDEKKKEINRKNISQIKTIYNF